MENASINAETNKIIPPSISFKGVQSHRNNFQTRIYYFNERTSFGTYTTTVDAAKAFDIAIRILRHNDPNLLELVNFPDEVTEPLYILPHLKESINDGIVKVLAFNTNIDEQLKNYIKSLSTQGILRTDLMKLVDERKKKSCSFTTRTQT